MQIKLSELDAVLKDLEQAEKVKLTEIRGCRVGGIGGRPMIIDYLSQPPEEEVRANLSQPPEKEAKKKGWWQF